MYTLNSSSLSPLQFNYQFHMGLSIEIMNHRPVFQGSQLLDQFSMDENPLLIWPQANMMFVSRYCIVYRIVTEARYKHYYEKSQKVFMKLFSELQQETTYLPSCTRKNPRV